MVFILLLLISLTCCVCGISEPHVYLNYQAEANDNITVEWSYSAQVDIVKIHCVSLSGLKVFFNLDDKVHEEPQHQQYAGRVQCDKEALRTGRVRLHLSRVRTDDSGQYLCRMATGSGRRVRDFRLKITAASDKPKPVTSQPATTTPKPATTTPKPAAESRGRVGLYVALGVGLTAAAAAAAAAVLAVCRWKLCHTKLHTTTGARSRCV